MKVKDNILNDIVPIKMVDNVSSILSKMEELKFVHLPVTDEEQTFLGLINEDDLLEAENDSDPLSKHKHFLRAYSIPEKANLFEALKVVGLGNLSLLPVINDGQDYLGYLSPLEIIQDMGRQLTFTEPGSVLVLEIPTRDYQLSQIAQLVEAEDARIIGFHLTTSEQSDMLHLSLKINQKDLSTILKSFERYNYTILMVFHESLFDDTLADRYESFMNYLKV
jgi:acetoin utilization protein AcuB